LTEGRALRQTDLVTGPSPSVEPIVDQAKFRHVLGHFVTGVTIITATDRDTTEPVGLAASSFTSVSLDPPLVLFCAGRSSTTWPRIQAAGRYCVNILNDDQELLARQFAGKGDKFVGVGWRAGATGSPVLESALAWLDCLVESEIVAGDHLIVVGRVQALGAKDHGGPLAYFRGGYGVFGR
jgi:3-hydroxy-9,10-secoandrosta-1,3,5(10)-triene-9,17-dione monooxygenase reductase component